MQLRFNIIQVVSLLNQKHWHILSCVDLINITHVAM